MTSAGPLSLLAASSPAPSWRFEREVSGDFIGSLVLALIEEAGREGVDGDRRGTGPPPPAAADVVESLAGAWAWVWAWACV